MTEMKFTESFIELLRIHLREGQSIEISRYPFDVVIKNDKGVITHVFEIKKTMASFEEAKKQVCAYQGVYFRTRFGLSTVSAFLAVWDKNSSEWKIYQAPNFDNKTIDEVLYVKPSKKRDDRTLLRWLSCVGAVLFSFSFLALLIPIIRSYWCYKELVPVSMPIVVFGITAVVLWLLPSLLRLSDSVSLKTPIGELIIRYKVNNN